MTLLASMARYRDTFFCLLHFIVIVGLKVVRNPPDLYVRKNSSQKNKYYLEDLAKLTIKCRLMFCK
jgi:hypothetical protein